MAASSSSYVAGLVPKIRKVLASADLTTVSAKAVRKQLISQGENEDLIKASRVEIDEHISEIYEELAQAANQPSSDDVPLGGAPSSVVAMPQSSQPEPLRKKVKKETSRSPERKPRSAKIDPDLRENETDEQMAMRLQREYDLIEGRSRASRSAATGRNPRKQSKITAKRKSRATVSDGEDGNGDGSKKRRGGGGSGAFNKELILSDELAAFTGEARLSRPQTVKRIWDYVKANDLQDPGDKRFIMCDARLRAVFHTDRLHMFTMNKLLVPHFRDPDEVIYKDEPAPFKSEPATSLTRQDYGVVDDESDSD